MNPLILEAMKDGCYICYAPVSGGLCMLTKDGDMADKANQPTIQEFLTLRAESKIIYSSTMMQGHHIFHGRVDFYKLA